MEQLWLSDWRSLMGPVLHWLAGGDPYGAFTMPDGTAYEAGWYAYPPATLLLVAPLALLPGRSAGCWSNSSRSSALNAGPGGRADG